MARFRRSQYNNLLVQVGWLIVTYDIRNHPRWRRRRWRVRWQDPKADFLTLLRKDLEKIRRG